MYHKKFKPFFDMSSGKMINSVKEVKEKESRGQVLISNKEARQEAEKNRKRIESENNKKNEYALNKAAYLLSHGERHIAQRIMEDMR